VTCGDLKVQQTNSFVGKKETGENEGRSGRRNTTREGGKDRELRSLTGNQHNSSPRFEGTGKNYGL